MSSPGQEGEGVPRQTSGRRKRLAGATLASLSSPDKPGLMHNRAQERHNSQRIQIGAIDRIRLVMGASRRGELAAWDPLGAHFLCRNLESFPGAISHPRMPTTKSIKYSSLLSL